MMQSLYIYIYSLENTYIIYIDESAKIESVLPRNIYAITITTHLATPPPPSPNCVQRELSNRRTFMYTNTCKCGQHL